MAKTYNYQVAGDVTVSTTGNIDDLDFSKCAVVRMTNASDATIRGLKAGYDGQTVFVVSAGAGNVFLAHQNAGSLAANRLICKVTTLDMPLAAGSGSALLCYDVTTARWRVLSHNQGAAIAYTPVWSSTGVAPTTGNATLSGSYTLIEATVIVNFHFVFGSTSAGGTGAWTFSLKGTYSHPGSGSGVATKTAVSSNNGCSTVGGGTVLVMVDNTTGVYTAASPFAWAATDFFDMTISYDIS